MKTEINLMRGSCTSATRSCKLTFSCRSCAEATTLEEGFYTRIEHRSAISMSKSAPHTILSAKALFQSSRERDRAANKP